MNNVCRSLKLMISGDFVMKCQTSFYFILQLYASRIPERFMPGKCDIWFQSHQVKIVKLDYFDVK
jgi:hypothetical protein